jgi:voltage-gated potassium channel
MPAFRIFRIARAFRAARVARVVRSARLVSIVSSVNRGMRALRDTLGRRGFGYVVALTVVVILVGAAGMQAFERELPGGRGLDSYATSLWWTAMIITTLGSDYWPLTPEGRVLCLLLAMYSFAVWGYITASLATFFLDRDAADSKASIAGERSLELLRSDIAMLRAEVQSLRQESAERP